MRLLELPAVTTQLCFSFLSPSDVVSVGLTCRSSAFFLFCETYFEWAAPDGDSPAAPAPPRLDSDTIPSLFGDKPVISRREDIPECVKECWKVWRAVCEARGFEPEPHRSPYVVCKSRMAAEANFRRGAYKRYDLTWTPTEDVPVGPGMKLDAPPAAHTHQEEDHHESDPEPAVMPPPQHTSVSVAAAAAKGWKGKPLSSPSGPLAGRGKPNVDRSNLTRVYSMQLFYSAEGLPRALTLHEQDSWRAAVKFVGDSLLWDVKTRHIVDLCKFPNPDKFLPEFMSKGADGPCGNYDATEDYFVTVVGEQRNKLAVYESAHPPTPADSAAGGKPARTHTLEGHTRPITWLIVHGGRAYSSSYDFSLRVWDLCAGGPATHTHTFAGAIMRMLTLRGKRSDGEQTRADGTVPIILVAASSDGALRAYPESGSRCIGELLSAHESSILCLESCPCSKMIVTGSRDGSVRVWSVEQRFLDAAECAALAATGGLVVGEPQLAVNFVCLAELVGHLRWITAVTMDHYRVMTSSLEGLKLWSFSAEDVSADESTAPSCFHLMPSFVFPSSGALLYNSRRKRAVDPTFDSTVAVERIVPVPAGVTRGEAAKTMDEIIATGKARFWKKKYDGEP